jgi:hypothetical protein
VAIVECERGGRKFCIQAKDREGYESGEFLIWWLYLSPSP